MATKDTLFKTALQAIDDGEKERARDLLTRLLKSDRDVAEYWLWMSATVDTARERIFCLKEVLRIDPNNQTAKRGLIMEGTMPPDEKLAIPLHLQQRRWQTDVSTSASTLDKLLVAPTWLQVSLLLGVLLLVSGLVYLAVSGAGKIDLASIFKRETAIVLNLTPVLTPSDTPGPVLPTPTLSGPTPIWMLMESTYTPTPLYVNTPHARSEDYRNAMHAYEREDWISVINFMQQALKFDPEAPDIHYYIGEAYRFMEDYQNAYNAYEQAIEIDPGFAPAYLGRGLVRLSIDPTMGEESDADIENAIELDPNLIEAYRVLTEKSINEGDGETALIYLETILTLAPESATAYLYQAQAFMLEDQPEESLDAAQHANELDITLLPAYRLIGQAHILLGSAGEAASVLGTYTLFYPDDIQALTWLGQAHIALEEYDLALKALDQALEVDPNYMEALLQIGEVYLAQEETNKAISTFLDVTKLNARSFSANLGLGVAYLQQNRNQDAYSKLSYTKTLATSEEELAKLYYWRARTLENMNEISAALRDWQALLNLPEETVQEDWILFATQRLDELVTPTRTITATKTTPPASTGVPSRTVTPTITSQFSPSATITHTSTSTKTSTQTSTPTPVPTTPKPTATSGQ
ncbi:MAG: tetratricopeptide repeat protein [Anaerolineaceae bacterium]|nr:tetratricopeptide repeat protein [Anaerolineaceae bacterium]